MVRRGEASGPIEITVDKDACAGFAECMRALPAVFRVGEDGTAQLVPGGENAASVDAIVDAAQRCPNCAITVRWGAKRLV